MAAQKKSTMISTGTVAKNRKAHFNYAIEETVEAGLILTGAEVKSLRLGRASINEAYAGVQDGELYLINASILEYGSIGYMKHTAARPRKLLVHKKELKRLSGAVARKGYTLIPLELYFNARGIAKIKIGLGVGKNNVDRREDIKKRDWDREKRRLLKGG
ncbi:MAG: SsrA-binding protein SmpB [Alphaproteobacteria bacterium]|nr:SsrA-binding protein SmpB [Alphaproteobacteria bacterium]MBQ8347171.1 SsrA-binding protein SmpB [Alphaproteobacteria bacterium]